MVWHPCTISTSAFAPSPRIQRRTRSRMVLLLRPLAAHSGLLPVKVLRKKRSTLVARRRRYCEHAKTSRRFAQARRRVPIVCCSLSLWGRSDSAPSASQSASLELPSPTPPPSFFKLALVASSLSICSRIMTPVGLGWTFEHVVESYTGRRKLRKSANCLIGATFCGLGLEKLSLAGGGGKWHGVDRSVG